MGASTSSTTPHDVLVVGASLAGLRTVQELRRRGYDGKLTLVGDESELPYDRPPLSKGHLAADHTGDPIHLITEPALADLEVELVLGRTAVRTDPSDHTVRLDDGTTLAWDRLVIATGVRPRFFGAAGSDREGFLALRTLADAHRLRAELDKRPRVAVLGGGFIGSEVAAAARRRDLSVTLIEMLPAPMSAGLGTRVGELLGRLHIDHGALLRCNTTVAGVQGNGRVEQLVLGDGSVVDTDLVVVGIGAVPSTECLAGIGLDLTNGVLCGADLRVFGTDDIYAAGDVARWPHPLFGLIRVEHWTNAQEHAAVVAGALLGENVVANAIPYVWSDQYERRLQIIGRPQAGHTVTVVEDKTDGGLVAAYEHAGILTGVLVVDAPKLMLRARKAIAAGSSAAAYLAEHVPDAVAV
jgi:NAD(P)H-nitrite reductase